MNYLAKALKSFTKRYYLIMSLMFTFSSFFYIGEPQFWTILGFGVLCNGLDDLNLKTT